MTCNPSQVPCGLDSVCGTTNRPHGASVRTAGETRRGDKYVDTSRQSPTPYFVPVTDQLW